MRRIAVIHHKGGVGKSTTTVNLASAEMELSGVVGREAILRDLLDQELACWLLWGNAGDNES